MTLFLSFNRFLSRVESWNGWHMLIFPRRHAATFSNDFGWNINAILRKLSIHHSLFCFFVVNPIYLESTVKQRWIPFVFCLFCICLRVFLTHLSPTNTLIWKFASTHTVTHARVHTKKWKHQKEALPASCLVSSLQAILQPQKPYGASNSCTYLTALCLTWQTVWKHSLDTASPLLCYAPQQTGLKQFGRYMMNLFQQQSGFGFWIGEWKEENKLAFFACFENEFMEVWLNYYGITFIQVCFKTNN